MTSMQTPLETLLPADHAQYSYANLLRELRARDRQWLDIGCGHGVVPEWTERRGDFAPTLGIDLDRGALRRHPTVKWRVCGSGESLPVATGAMDFVTANMVLEHVADPLSFFAEVSRVLRPGGQFVFLTPNEDAYTTRLARLLPERVKAPLARFLHERDSADVYPALYRANTPFALRELGALSGLAMLVRPIPTGLQLHAVPVLRTFEQWYIDWFAPMPCLLAVGTKLSSTEH